MGDVRISAMGGDQGGGHSVTISGLTCEEKERLEGMMQGMWWVSCSGGNLRFSSALEELPPPARDESMMPFWRRFNSEGCGVQMEFAHFGQLRERSSPSIEIQHLCGYNFTPEGYAEQAALLESYGFECLRSRRGEDGKFWEVWRLCGLWGAKGKLKDALSRLTDEKKKLDAAVSFLCSNASFGALDLTVQQCALQLE